MDGDNLAFDETAELIIRSLQARLRLLEKLASDREQELQHVHQLLARMFLAGRLNGIPLHRDADVELERAVLATDISAFSRLSPPQRGRAIQLLDVIGGMVLGQHGSEFGNDWGDAIVSVFLQPNEAIEAGLRLVRLMAAEGFALRVGLSFGGVSRVWKQIQRKWGFDGIPLIEAARLEPIAQPGEVIAAPSLVHSGLVDFERFAVTRVSRAWMKGFGAVREGDPAEIFVLREHIKNV